jgi:cardiolipin synthase
VIVSCVGLKPPEAGSPPPIVAMKPLSDAASQRVLNAALDEYRNDARAIDLIDSVRRHSTQPLSVGNRVTALVDGPATFASIREAVSAARHHIHVETFIYDDDELGREFGELLAKKRREGVEVRVLYDSVGSMETDAAFFESLRGKDIEVREFRPMNPAKTPLIWKIQNRDHRKIIVVDGAVGFTGGVNISGTYASSSSTKPGPERGVDEGWRDTHVRIEGPAVAQLQSLFFDTWGRAGGTIACCDAAYFPSLEPNGPHLVTIVASSSEGSSDQSLYAVYLAAFRKAQSRLWITHAYFAPNDDLLDAMIEAAQRGVDVRMIAPGFTDSGPILYATQSTYTRLLKGGVRIFERDDALLHAKSVVIDGTVSIVGSANLDMRSFLHNDEVNAIVISRDFGKEMERIFERDEKASRPLDLERWSDRGLWQRMKEWSSKLLWYWL